MCCFAATAYVIDAVQGLQLLKNWHRLAKPILRCLHKYTSLHVRLGGYVSSREGFAAPVRLINWQLALQKEVTVRNVAVWCCTMPVIGTWTVDAGGVTCMTVPLQYGL